MTGLGNVTLADIERQRSELLARVESLREAHRQAKKERKGALVEELQRQMESLWSKLRELKRLRGDVMYANQDPRLSKVRLFANIAQEVLPLETREAIWREVDRRHAEILQGIADRRQAQSTGAAVAPVGEPGPMRLRAEERVS